ncbi:hypothetical protein BDZ97DRAFT_19099 [Flammula alnicola]|nr:hypothetical protein BDZ97DRAFT_19099 [Flammula alnicola]
MIDFFTVTTIAILLQIMLVTGRHISSADKDVEMAFQTAYLFKSARLHSAHRVHNHCLLTLPDEEDKPSQPVNCGKFEFSSSEPGAGNRIPRVSLNSKVSDGIVGGWPRRFSTVHGCETSQDGRQSGLAPGPVATVWDWLRPRFLDSQFLSRGSLDASRCKRTPFRDRGGRIRC